MAQEIKALEAKPDNQRSTPGAHIVEGKNLFPRIVLWLPHDTGACGNVM